MFLKKIISGGQTGVDIAALDAAIDCGIEHGGWIPRGRKTEDGPLHPRYTLKQTSSRGYKVRTEMNVVSADATIIFGYGSIHRMLNSPSGTRQTYDLADQHSKSCLYIDLMDFIFYNPSGIAGWLEDGTVSILNVAGPRASREPNIYYDTHKFLTEVFKTLLNECRESLAPNRS